MSDASWNIARLTDLGRAYWLSSVLHAALRTGIVAELVKGPATADALAERLDLDSRATGMLLAAMESLDLAVLDQGAASLAPGLDQLLDPEGQRSLYHYCLHMATVAPNWTHLSESVASGQPLPRPPMPEDGSLPPGRVHFYRGMRDLGRLAAPGLAGRLGMQPDWHVLDLGGGPGVYALHFAAEVPGLRATVFDLPVSRQFFEANTAGHPAAGAVDFMAGDFLEDDLGGPYDAVWMSHILHSNGPRRCVLMLQKAASALKPGGRLWVQDFLLGAEGTAGRFAAIFALNMLVNTNGGRTYSFSEVAEFMTQAGLEDISDLGRIRPRADGWLVGARKPL